MLDGIGIETGVDLEGVTATTIDIFRFDRGIVPTRPRRPPRYVTSSHPASHRPIRARTRSAYTYLGVIADQAGVRRVRVSR